MTTVPASNELETADPVHHDMGTTPGEGKRMFEKYLDACIRYDEGGASPGGEETFTADLDVQDLAFDSPGGRYAGEGLGIELRGEMQGGAPGGARLSGRLRSGAVLFDQLYAEFAASPLRFEATPQFDGERLAALAFNLADDGSTTWIWPRAVESPHPHFPQALGVVELWGRWCYDDEDAFRAADEARLAAALRAAGCPRG